MKKFLFGFAILAGVGSAVAGTNSKQFATRYYQALPSNKAATCTPIACNEILGPACTFLPGYTGYKSVDAEPNCNTPVTLYKH